MAERPDQDEARYCLGCFYSLKGLSDQCCPECGRKFDPGEPKTFSRFGHMPLLPRWETCVSGLLLSAYIYMSWDWFGVQDALFGRKTRLIHWSDHETGPVIFRFDQLFWVSPFIVLIPLFLISGIRVLPRSRWTSILTFLVLAVYVFWPGTLHWFRDLPGTLQQIFEWEGFWEAWKKNLTFEEV